MIEHVGQLRGEGRRFGIVVSRYHEVITRSLLEGACGCLLRHGVDDDAIEAVWVPGAWEIPGALRRLEETDRFDALIALGCVIRGATPHFEYVAGEAARGTAAVADDADVPVVFGVLTVDTLEQAAERAGNESDNKGWEAALAALETADLYEQLREHADA